MLHPDAHAITRYLDGDATEIELIEISSHLADCASCLENVQTASYLKRNFDLLWRSWTPERHGRISEAVRIADALSSQPLSPVSEWIKTLGFDELPGLAATFILDSTKRLAGAAARSFDQMFDCRPVPVQAGVGSPDTAATLQKHLNLSSLELSRQNADAAEKALDSAAEIDAFSVQSAGIEISEGDRFTARLVVDSRKRRVSVVYFPDKSKKFPGYVLLLPADPSVTPSIAAFSPVESASYYLADFKELPDGLFTLYMGPATGFPGSGETDH